MVQRVEHSQHGEKKPGRYTQRTHTTDTHMRHIHVEMNIFLTAHIPSHAHTNTHAPILSLFCTCPCFLSPLSCALAPLLTSLSSFLSSHPSQSSPLPFHFLLHLPPPPLYPTHTHNLLNTHSHSPLHTPYSSTRLGTFHIDSPVLLVCSLLLLS